MDATEPIRRLHRHRMWANARVLAVAVGLTDEQWDRPMSIGQGSIRRTLYHLYAADYVWLEALLGDDDPLLPGDLPGQLPGNQRGGGGIAGIDDLIRKWAVLDRRWAEYLDALTPESLDQIVWKVSTSSGAGKRFGTKRIDVLLHLCTHAQYTTAQLVNMCRQAGATELPDVMLVSMARQEILERDLLENAP